MLFSSRLLLFMCVSERNNYYINKSKLKRQIISHSKIRADYWKLFGLNEHSNNKAKLQANKKSISNSYLESKEPILQPPPYTEIKQQVFIMLKDGTTTYQLALPLIVHINDCTWYMPNTSQSQQPRGSSWKIPKSFKSF